MLVASIALGALLTPFAAVALCVGAIAGGLHLGDGDHRPPSVVGHRAQAGAEVHVVVPIRASRVRDVASDIDAELREARERLDDVLAWARAEGMQVSGRVGDPNIALGAIEDELRVSSFDEAIVSTLPRGRSNWLETAILERLREDLDVPITHMTADVAGRTTAAR